MKPAAFVIAAALALMPVAAAAQAGSAMDVLCDAFPQLSKCRVAPAPAAPVRLPQSKPVEIVPVPDIPAAVAPVSPWHEPPKAAPAPPPATSPKAEPPKRLPQVRIAKPKSQEQPLKPQPRQQPKASDTYDNSILYPCSWVCWHVDGKSKAQLLADKAFYKPSPRQEAHGRACVVNTCPGNVPPDVLAQMKREMGRR